MNNVMKQNPELVRNMMDAVQRSQTGPEMPSSDIPRREMAGPGMDFGSLMNMMGPGMPQSTRPIIRDDESVSDIVSIDAQSDTKEVRVTDSKKGGRGRPRKSTKKEVSL
jgi:hypothetical protein